MVKKKYGNFKFNTVNPVTKSEGEELETLLLNWALTHKNRITFYWYETIEKTYW